MLVLPSYFHSSFKISHIPHLVAILSLILHPCRQQATIGLSSSSSLYWLVENVKKPMHFSQRVGTQIPVLWSGLVSKRSFQKMEKLLNAVWPKSSAKYCKALQSIFMHHYSNGNVILPLGSGLGIPLLQDPLRKELK